MSAPCPDPPAGLHLTPEALDQLLPIHVMFGADGVIQRWGPTFEKLVGHPLRAGLEIDAVLKLRGVAAARKIYPSLMASGGRKLTLSLKALPDLPMRGICVPQPDGLGGVLHVSLGQSFAEAVQRRSLVLSDFSPCDQTVDLLYLREATEAVAAESQRLTDRLVASERAANMRAATDELTGLGNRRALTIHLDHLTRLKSVSFAVMQLDIDHFKEINDLHGHHAGDAILGRMGQVLAGIVRRDDFAARTGGDEFVLVLRGADDPVTLDQVAQRIFKGLQEPFPYGGAEIKFSTSIGTTQSTLYAQPDGEQMLRDADEALYASKKYGRGRNCFFQPQGMDTRPMP